jgi:hypothetical protein
MNFDDEPSMNKIDDYNGNESEEKKSIINNILLGLLLVGAIYAGIRYANSTVSDYNGTPEKPGINTTKGY